MTKLCWVVALAVAVFVWALVSLYYQSDPKREPWGPRAKPHDDSKEK